MEEFRCHRKASRKEGMVPELKSSPKIAIFKPWNENFRLMAPFSKFLSSLEVGIDVSLVDEERGGVSVPSVGI